MHISNLLLIEKIVCMFSLVRNGKNIVSTPILLQ